MQPDTASDDDRGCIIDAAYGCLSEPHTGPIPVAAILQRAGVSTRAFYRHFESKDELFLAMLRQEGDALADRLDRIVDKPGAPVDQLKAWIRQMFGWMHDAELRMHLTVIDSDEVRAAKGYRETRERAHADRERSLVEILRARPSRRHLSRWPTRSATRSPSARSSAARWPTSRSTTSSGYNGHWTGCWSSRCVRWVPKARPPNGDEFGAPGRSDTGKPP